MTEIQNIDTNFCANHSFMSMIMFHLMDKQVPPVQNQPKPAGIVAKKRIQNALKMYIEATINQTFSRGRSPESTLREGHTPTRTFPLPPEHFQRRGDGPDRIDTVPNLGKTLAFSIQKHEQN